MSARTQQINGRPRILGEADAGDPLVPPSLIVQSKPSHTQAENLLQSLLSPSSLKALRKGAWILTPYRAGGFGQTLKWFNEPVRPHEDAGSLTRLGLAIYENRVDLQKAFRDVFGRDHRAFCAWMLQAGNREYHLADSLLEFYQRSLAETLSPDNDLFAHGAMECQEPSANDGSSRFGKVLVAAWNSLTGRLGLRAIHTKPKSLKPGVDVFGCPSPYPRIDEAAHAAHRALTSAGLPAHYHVAGEGPPNPNARQSDFNTHLYHVDAVDVATTDAPCAVGLQPYKIGYLSEDASLCAEVCRRSVERFHEMWVGSSFLQETLSGCSPLPVVTMPPPITPKLVPTSDCDFLGVRQGGFTFLHMYDGVAFQRKNPLGVVSAFRKAFASEQGVQLVMALCGVPPHGEQAAQLREAAKGLNVLMIFRSLSRGDVSRLLCRCDAYVSLHRCVGFGQRMAEAAYFGKPVISTGYSGNTEFMSDGLLVDYALTDVDDGSAPFFQCWAEPSLRHAAELMRQVSTRPESAAEQAEATRQTVLTQFSLNAAGERMKSRLQSGPTSDRKDSPAGGVHRAA